MPNIYSVIECGGFQHKVAVGETVRVPLMEAKVGDTVTVADVLLFASGDKVIVGQPKVTGAAVKLEVLQHDRDDKVIVFKRKRRKRYRLTKGHRQDFTEVLVAEIACGADKQAVDAGVRERARKRATALQNMKVQVKKPTRKEKIAAAAKA
jgi:ribosomal protein L21